VDAPPCLVPPCLPLRSLILHDGRRGTYKSVGYRDARKEATARRVRTRGQRAPPAGICPASNPPGARRAPGDASARGQRPPPIAAAAVVVVGGRRRRHHRTRRYEFLARGAARAHSLYAVGADRRARATSPAVRRRASAGRHAPAALFRAFAFSCVTAAARPRAATERRWCSDLDS
jgi:hypothetical protein